ncbi:hypothetical protein ACROYT_G002555 [Oculina patagonica]
MVNNKRSLRALLHEFAETTSAHGVGRIASSESVVWRLFWVLVTLTGCGMVIYQGILLVNTYQKKPVKSNIDVTYKRTIRFPAVTICNLNIIKKSFIHNYPDADSITSSFNSSAENRDNGPATSKSSGSKNSTFDLPDEQMKKSLMNSLKTDSSDAEVAMNLENVTIDPEVYNKGLALTKLAKYSQAELERGGHHFPELVFRCAFKTFSCKDGDFLKYWKTTWNWRYGNCFTFNSGVTRSGRMAPVLTTTKPGPQYGLTLDLFVNQNEYIPLLSQEAGVRVLITGQHNIPFPVDEGFTVSPGFATSIGLRKLNIIRVDPFNNGSCYKSKGLEDFSVYQQFQGSRYSVQGCMNSCLARAQLESCNCTEAKFKFGKRICSAISKEVRCIQELQKRYDSDELGCSEKCPQPCTQTSYRTSMSSSAWSIAYEKQIQSMMLREGGEMGKSKDMLRENILRIKIYFEELNLERITYSEYYALENLMSDIGGQLGLWIGLSVITVAEVFQLLLDIIKVLCRKTYRTEVKDTKDISML